VGISRLLNCLIGPLSDVIGRKGLLLAGMSVSMLGALGCVMTSDYRCSYMFRVMQALGCGCFVLSQALVQDLFEGEERDRLRILMVTATGMFISVSPLAGTFLQAWLGWRGSFWVFTALAAVVLIKAWLFLDQQPSGPQRHTPRFHSVLSTRTGGFRVCRLLADLGLCVRLPLLVHRHFTADLHGSTATRAL
jgi:MFS family permease